MLNEKICNECVNNMLKQKDLWRENMKGIRVGGHSLGEDIIDIFVIYKNGSETKFKCERFAKGLCFYQLEQTVLNNNVE